MTEFFHHQPDYFSDYAPQLNAISNRVFEITSDPDTVVMFNFETNSPNVIRGSSQFLSRQVSLALNKLITVSQSQPNFGSYAAVELGSSPERTLIESTVLINAFSAPYAARASILREDGAILEMASVVHVRGQPVEASRKLVAGHDDLMEMVPFYTKDAAIQEMIIWTLLMKPAGNDLDTSLQNILAKTSVEEKQAVAIMLNYVRDRLLQEQASDDLARQHGTDRPSFQELQDLLQFLHRDIA